MKAFNDLNPITTFIYLTATAVIPMFSMNPVILAASLFCALFFWFVNNGRKNMKSHLFYIALFIIITLVNPLFSHNGRTVLFVMNNNPVTLEAFCFGAAMGTAAVSVMYWLRSFSQIMTSDRIMYIFGSFSPKTSLVMSMTLRYVPLFTSAAKRTRLTQKAMGLYCADDKAENLRSSANVFSAVTTWALENGIVTADSMNARGYATGRRSSFAIFRFRKYDVVLLIICVLLFALSVSGIADKASAFLYYPDISSLSASPLSIISYSAYTLLAALPTLINIGEKSRWKYLKSKI